MGLKLMRKISLLASGFHSFHNLKIYAKTEKKKPSSSLICGYNQTPSLFLWKSKDSKHDLL